ncbi:prohibitin [Bathycoccus prasinos]|jgi:prohibitin 1|uniref:Prohibitin n=1 Tax=Bathycoccus prasinos TaxID=41875 RepID=K8F806_9CHLO|nr:prohibitin [Bathycoccus prasinos]CCO17743.1 prohibitin [Bathycoccus prasinos]|eukprot:XP_007511622.1 prohibitin [Bathycoccus prasinos]
MASSSAQVAAQALGALARMGAFVGIGATAVSSAMYDGTLRIASLSLGDFFPRGEKRIGSISWSSSLSRLLLLNLSVLLSFVNARTDPELFHYFHSSFLTTTLTVDGGERAVMFDRFRGVLKDTSAEGTHFMVPIIQSPTIYDVRTRPKSLSSVTGTKDLQQVNLTLRVLCRPNVEQLSTIHLNLGPDYDDRVLPSIGNEVLKATVAQYNADELLTRRQEVTEQIAKSLRKRADDFGILLEDVALTHLSFSHEYSRAIEAKQVAQQDAERAKFEVMKSEQEREAAVIRAEGESESAKLISQATRSAGPALIELRRIEAAREVAKTLSGSKNIVYLPGGNGSNMLIGVNP